MVSGANALGKTTEIDMNLEKTNHDIKKDRQKRTMGCAGWAVILSFLAIIFFGIWANVGRGYLYLNIFTGWKPSDFLSFFTIFLLPTLILSMIIGSRTKPGSNLLLSALIIVPLVTCIYTLFLYLDMGFGIAISDTPPTKTFWHPVSIGLTAIFFGIILGIIASFGYWHAGRKK